MIYTLEITGKFLFQGAKHRQRNNSVAPGMQAQSPGLALPQCPAQLPVLTRLTLALLKIISDRKMQIWLHREAAAAAQPFASSPWCLFLNDTSLLYEEAKKSMSLLPALPGFGRKAVPLQGCAFCPRNPGLAVLSKHALTSLGMLCSSLLTQRRMCLSQHEGLAPHLARTYPESTSTRKDFTAIC